VHQKLISRNLLRDFKFLILFFAAAIGTFPLFVPPFFLPLCSRSIGLSSSTGAALVAAFNFASAIGRLACGFSSDLIGPLNTLLITLLLSALSMLALWPESHSLGPLLVFSIINGTSNGGFFAVIPTVIGNVFGSARISVAMGMVVTGWTAGYLFVSTSLQDSYLTFQGAPIAGSILDAYGGQDSSFEAYHPAIFYAGSLALASAGLVGFVRIKMNKKLVKKL
jgi:MFS family permease